MSHLSGKGSTGRKGPKLKDKHEQIYQPVIGRERGTRFNKSLQRRETGFPWNGEAFLRCRGRVLQTDDGFEKIESVNPQIKSSQEVFIMLKERRTTVS